VTTETNGRPLVRRLRAAVQWAVFALTVWGGVDLYRFVRLYEAGQEAPFAKPLSPEGFLPIGSLMSFKLWVTTGFFDPVHPAALVFFATAIGMSLLLKKSFCGWICPVGTLSELFWKAPALAGGRPLRLPKRLDLPLRSLKYVLLGFFLWFIVLKMPLPGIRGWLQSDYWKTADLRMLAFFRHPSALAGSIVLALAALSLATKNFWCRYACPYGALLGLASLASPVKVRRDDARCTHCGRCGAGCPALLPVQTLARVRSPECTGCLTCVSRCPAPGALDASLPGRVRVPPAVYAVLVVALFFGAIAAAAALGHWQVGVSPAEYRWLIPGLADAPHP
jgi:polyferredoxin